MTSFGPDTDRTLKARNPDELARYSINPEFLLEIASHLEGTSTEETSSLIVQATAFEREMRDSVTNALDEYIVGLRDAEQPAFLDSKHRSSIELALGEIAANTVYYAYAGLSSSDKRALVSNGGDTTEISLEEPRPVEIRVEIQSGTLVVTVSGGFPPPEDFQERWEKSSDAEKQDRSPGEALSAGDLSLDELEALLSGETGSADLGGRGLELISDVFQNLRIYGDNISFISDLPDFLAAKVA